MTTWLYQLSHDEWPPNRYRLEIWEGERWVWPVKKAVWGGTRPKPGDTVVFYYAKSKSTDPGFYGWAVITEWFENNRDIYFRPVAPSDYLKMNPWWNDEAAELADQIRGSVKQGTLWKIEDDLVPKLRSGIQKWTNYA